MTNWMTAAGIALIAGGIATLIGFRHALRGGDDRRAARKPGEIEARRVAASTAPAQVRGDVAQPQAPRRRRAPAASPAGRPARAASRSQAVRAKAVAGGDDHTGSLASIGLADEEDELAPEIGPGGEEPSGEIIEQGGRPGARRPAVVEEAPETHQRLAGTADRDEPHIDRCGRVRAGLDEPAADRSGTTRTGLDEPAADRSGTTRTGLDEDDNELLEVALTTDDGPAADRHDVPPVRYDGPAADRHDVPPVRYDGPAADRHDVPPVRYDGPAADLDEDAVAEEGAVQAGAPPAPATPTARSERYGDRVDGWVRPEYREPDLTGQYWTPAPESAYADEAYGWPVPVERLPEVPPYPPSSGFDVPVEVNEQTRVVPQWPPAKPSDRIELPRSWGDRNPRNSDAVTRWEAQDHKAAGMDWPVDDDAADDADQPQRAQRRAVMMRRGRVEDAEPPGRGRGQMRRRISPSAEAIPALGDSTQMLPPVDGPGDGEVRRPRPRPRPAHPDRSTVYVSKHAADPA